MTTTQAAAQDVKLPRRVVRVMGRVLLPGETVDWVRVAGYRGSWNWILGTIVVLNTFIPNTIPIGNDGTFVLAVVFVVVWLWNLIDYRTRWEVTTNLRVLNFRSSEGGHLLELSFRVHDGAPQERQVLKQALWGDGPAGEMLAGSGAMTDRLRKGLEPGEKVYWGGRPRVAWWFVAVVVVSGLVATALCMNWMIEDWGVLTTGKFYFRLKYGFYDVVFWLSALWGLGVYAMVARLTRRYLVTDRRACVHSWLWRRSMWLGSWPIQRQLLILGWRTEALVLSCTHWVGFAAFRMDGLSEPVMVERLVRWVILGAEPEAGGGERGGVVGGESAGGVGAC